MSLFDPVNAVLKRYHAQFDLTNLVIKVDDLRSIFEELGYVDTIIWERFNFDSKFILAQIQTYRAKSGVYKDKGTYARIQYSFNLNLCWRRFVVCKEMYHCLIDDTVEKRISSTAELLKLSEYLSDEFLEILAGEAGDSAAFDTEKLAEIFAIETLFPMELRRTLCDPLDANEISEAQIAERYKVPVFYVKQGMRPEYFSAVLRNRMDDLVIK
jgi:hypothetical protein